MLPKFGAASLFPPLDFSNNSSPPPARVYTKSNSNITRRYVFDASNISALQSKVASSAVPKPTRVETIQHSFGNVQSKHQKQIRGLKGHLCSAKK